LKKLVGILVSMLFLTSGFGGAQNIVKKEFSSTTFNKEIANQIKDMDNVPSFVDIGDILLIELEKFNPLVYSLWGWDHIAIYIGNQTFIHACTNGGVSKITFNLLKNWNGQIAFASVIGATNSQKNNAVDFCKNQLGKPYQTFDWDFNINSITDLNIARMCNRQKDDSSDSYSWYCSEIIWAAYLHCDGDQGPGIDIEQHRWGDTPDWVWPSEISASENILTYNGPYNLDEYSAKKFLEWIIDAWYYLNGVPDNLEKGDILFCDMKPLFSHLGYSIRNGSDHCAMYIGNGYLIEASSYFFRHDVQINRLSFFKAWAENITFGRVMNLTNPQKTQIVEFALSQLGKPYQIDYSHIPIPLNLLHATTNTSVPSFLYPDAWYCSELIWASYMMCDGIDGLGINLDDEEWVDSTWIGPDGNEYEIRYVGPPTLYNNVDLLFALNKKPVAQLSKLIISSINEKIILDSSKSYDPDGHIVRIDWWYDNKWHYKQNSTIEVVFNNTGTEKIMLRIWDDMGLNSKTTGLIILRK